jgi:hypothetical protein
MGENRINTLVLSPSPDRSQKDVMGVYFINYIRPQSNSRHYLSDKNIYIVRIVKIQI